MQIKNVKVYGLEESLIRSGYPMQIGEPSEINSDIKYDMFHSPESPVNKICITRSTKLANTPVGSGHNNFLKGIIVQFDLQYPEYFSPQLQRYHWVDIISSQSKMHKITSRELTKNDFTKYTSVGCIDYINSLINRYNIDKDADTFNQTISNLPSRYLKWMGILTNYLQLKTIYYQRRHHKLQEWQDFCKFLETLPMFELITNKTE